MSVLLTIHSYRSLADRDRGRYCGCQICDWLAARRRLLKHRPQTRFRLQRLDRFASHTWPHSADLERTCRRRLSEVSALSTPLR